MVSRVDLRKGQSLLGLLGLPLQNGMVAERRNGFVRSRRIPVDFHPSEALFFAKAARLLYNEKAERTMIAKRGGRS